MKKDGKILIIDDDEDVLTTARMILRPLFEHVQTEISPNKIPKLLHQENFDLVILDMNFTTGATSGNEGLFWLRQIKETDPGLHVIMNTAYGDINLAVTCMKEGAVDFLVKPWEKEKLIATVNNVFELSRQKKEIVRLKETNSVIQKELGANSSELIGHSKSIKAILEMINKVAATDANVLILGENGTGKEVAARMLHQKSNRSKSNFIKVDLGAMTPTLFESELFGHTKGAFTDAKEERAGRFELADNGTLFLDEIGNIPLSLQTKLLSVLQNRQINKVGSGKVTNINIRLITATNQPLYELAARDEFRQDLLYRINTVEIIMPPLHQRSEDIPLLISHFIRIYSKKYNKTIPEVDPNSIKKLQEYHWPGNIRELQHAVERAVIMHSKNELDANDFIPNRKHSAHSSPEKETVVNVEELEKMAIVNALEKVKGNLSKASELLGWGRSTLYRKMKKYNL